jgi:hypothetical protein
MQVDLVIGTQSQGVCGGLPKGVLDLQALSSVQDSVILARVSLFDFVGRGTSTFFFRNFSPASVWVTSEIKVLNGERSFALEGPRVYFARFWV